MPMACTHRTRLLLLCLVLFRLLQDRSGCTCSPFGSNAQMRFFNLIITSALLGLAPGVLGATSSSATSTTAPVCGLLCISSEALTSECSISNTTCICANEPLKAKIQTCTLANCTIREALETQKYSYTICGIESEDRTGMVWHLGIGFMIAGICAFLLRCLERLRSRTWGLDDYAIALVTLILIPMGALTVPLSQVGLGTDMWNVSFDNINQVLYYFYWEEILYAFALGFNKVAILLFYLRVFPQKAFRMAVYIMIGLNLSYSVAYTLAVVFQCWPLNGAWLSWDGEHEAKCVNINTLGWSGAGVNILFDLTTLILPLPVLAQLTMSLKKKLQILAMFAVGFFVTLVSILRLRSMIEFGSTVNVTQDYVEVGYWSTIEISIGITCACMPAIRALLVKLFPCVFTATEYHQSTSGNNYVSGQSGHSRKAYNSSSAKQSAHSKITVQNEWTVTGNAANRSDVELVAMDQKLGPFSARGHESGYVREKPADQWSSEGELPIQGRSGSM
ncbi:hypothetical protein BX600DRAFT_448936 [Xylariales sp. PMI_506]|nr:hypothetical protein BX600DRAFT_448936 [Xylariales sp. PMI_506]